MRRHLTAAALVSAVALLPAGTAVAAAPKKAPSPKAQAKSAFKRLVADTKAIPKRSASRRTRRALLRQARRAQQLRKRRPCKAVKVLGRYRTMTRKVRVKRRRSDRRPKGGSARGRLLADAIKANVALMALPRARRCGGGRPSRVRSVGATVLESDTKHLRMRLRLPPPTFTAKSAGGRDYQVMHMEGLGVTGGIGEPGVPGMSRFFGVPVGAGVSLTVNDTTSYTVDGVELFPRQREPVDQRLPDLPKGAPPRSTFADKPFTIDRRDYRSDAAFPRRPASGDVLGSIRGIRLGSSDIAGAQYRPDSERLRVFTSIDVTVKFTGDNQGNFGSAERIRNKWEIAFNRRFAGMFDNWGTINDHLIDIGTLPFCGEEMLVITSPELASAATIFHDGKEAQGISTSVRYVGSGPGQIGATKEEIQSFIRSRLNGGCIIRPTYVVLLGNTAAVPTWLVPCSAGGDVTECDIASDLPYSLDGLAGDDFADVMLGRIPATTAADAEAVVNKILTYQNTPPAPDGDPFYRRATVTAYFEPHHKCVLNAGQTGTPNCNPDAGTVTGHWEIDLDNKTDARGFTKTSEAIRGAMAAQSYSVERLFTTNAGVDPRFYYDGTPIPNNLRKPAFAWDADSDDFLGAYNEGRFLILHRDHGWPDGWADPYLHSGHIPLLNNGTKLPVVFGINCASAQFDRPDHPSFVELQTRRIGGGAVAAFGDTRNSPTWPNNNMARGFFDAMFPALQPSFGPDEPTRRLGDVLIHGKQFMGSVESGGGEYVEHYLYHLLGDPSTQMWADEPRIFLPPKIDTRYIPVDFPRPGDPPWKVHVRFPPIGTGDPPPFNTVATLLQNGEPIGRALVNAQGFAEITPEIAAEAENLRVAFDRDGALPAQDSVDGVPPRQAPPPAPRTATSLTLSGPSSFGTTDGPQEFSGRLEPGFAGATVRIVYTQDENVQGAPGTETITHTTTTSPTGAYTDELDLNDYATEGGDWHAQAFFDGDGGHLSSQSNTVAFTVGD